MNALKNIKSLLKKQKTVKILIYVAIFGFLPLLLWALVKLNFDIREKASQPVETTRAINENNNGQTIEITKGTKINLTLNTNPSTGYGWEFTNLNKNYVKIVSGPTYKVLGTSSDSLPQCNESCDFMVEPEKRCAEGLFCKTMEDRSTGVCRNEKCPNDNTCSCTNDIQISKTELEQGWYWGSKDQKKKGTPNTWILSADGTRSACWHDPNTGCGSGNPATEQVVGAPQKVTWILTTLKTGQTKIILAYKRKGDIKNLKTFEVTLKILDYVKPTASPSCITEGQTYQVINSNLSCCSNLTAIPDSNFSTSDPSGCLTMRGTMVCSRCGNGVCGQGENKCNCPKDCSSCPAPRTPTSNEICTQAITWALNPNTYTCCLYNNGCSPQRTWRTFPNQNSCLKGICNQTLPGNPTTAQKDSCTRAGGKILCGNGWCKCNCGVQPLPQCNESCDFMVEPEKRCAEGLFCKTMEDRSTGVCRNEKCPNDNTCSCTPPSPTPAACNESCNMSVNPQRPCIEGLSCYPLTRTAGADGVCRNDSCSEETDCDCSVTPTTLNINFKVKLAGVSNDSAEGAKVKLRFKNDSKSIDLQTNEITLTHDSNGIYKASTVLTSGQLPAATNYIIYVKGEKHLSNKYCSPTNQTERCTDSQGTISIPSTGTVNLDFSGYPLEPGDLQPQDGKADFADFLKIKGIMNKICDTQTTDDLFIGDLDYSKCVNVIDAFLMRKTLEVRYDEI